MAVDERTIRLTSLSSGGGCACKLPPGDLERLLAAMPFGATHLDLVVGADSGDDGAVVRLRDDIALVMTADFFSPVVDDPYDWGRIAAANALSDVYAMGGEPLLAINLLGWPTAQLSLELAAEVLRGGADVAADAGATIGGGHTIVDPEPKYGMAVTGLADVARLITHDAGVPGLPLTLTKPLGLGVLNNRHKMTGEWFPEAVATMATLNRDASRDALRRGIRCGTDVTGFGLLGHLLKIARASNVTAMIDSAAVPYLAGARQSLAAGYVPGGSRRNLSWVMPHLTSRLPAEELLLLADAQTSGGLLVAGEVPGYPIVGELVARTDGPLVVR